MKIIKKEGFRWTETVISALCAAGGFSFSDETVKNLHARLEPGPAGTWRRGLKRKIMCAGHVFHSRKDFGEWMLSQINGWMLENELVDLSPIRNARYQGSFSPFEICD